MREPGAPGGPAPGPAGARSFARSTWLFVRLLGVAWLCAFVSLATQVRALVGERGILPAGAFLRAARAAEGGGAALRHPTLLWLGSGDAALLALCALGTACAIALILDAFPAPALAGAWAAWLSLVVAGQAFLDYQWDSLLLEAGFVALFLVPPLAGRPRRAAFPPPAAAHWMLRLLLFKLMLSSGLAKLASGEPAWRDLTALATFYETQPLPTPVGWLAHQLPSWVHAASAAATLAIELFVPFLVLGPRRARLAAFFPLVALQAAIAATGNYGVFNLLAAALCLPLLDDAALPGWLRRRLPAPAADGRPWPSWVLAPVAAVSLVLAALKIQAIAGEGPEWPAPVRRLEGALDPFRTFNRYGPFAVLTITRPEIVLEGSRDGVTWREYELPWKPGDVRKAPRFVAPHQPRLDWQLWVAALSFPANHPFFPKLLGRMLEGDEEVLRLFARNPFPGEPPRYVRAVLYRYEFTDLATLRRDGAWWRRRRVTVRLYRPPVTLARRPGATSPRGAPPGAPRGSPPSPAPARRTPA